jgi:GTPase SAR1 family protein
VKAEALADHLEIQYMEVSSEEDINIKKLFETVTTDIIETFKKKPKDQIQQDKTYLLGIQDRNNNTENTKCSCW